MRGERIMRDDTVAEIKKASFEAGVESLGWFSELRQGWIHDIIHLYGYMKREHIMSKFNISSATATRDFALYMKTRPDTIFYNPKIKRYEVFNSGEKL